MNITCNEHVHCRLWIEGTTKNLYEFYADEGYALWRDNEEGNIDPETGEPWCYWFTISAYEEELEEYAHHIWAKFIDETMEVFGDTDQNQSELMTLGLDDEAEKPSTYIDENGVERDKKGVY